jgi:hypothetical protein
LKTLSENKILDWKLILFSGREIQGLIPFGQNHAYRKYENLQDLIKILFSDYLTKVSQLSHREMMQDRVEVKDGLNSCFVYLMIDRVNNFHKIGISNTPEYRERTLQSEKPTIELLAAKLYPSRKIAESIEKALHSTFKAKNIRGEWFNLDAVDIEQVSEVLK